MTINHEKNILTSVSLKEAIEKLKKYQKKTVPLADFIHPKKSKLTVLCEEALEEDNIQNGKNN